MGNLTNALEAVAVSAGGARKLAEGDPTGPSYTPELAQAKRDVMAERAKPAAAVVGTATPVAAVDTSAPIRGRRGFSRSPLILGNPSEVDMTDEELQAQNARLYADTKLGVGR